MGVPPASCQELRKEKFPNGSLGTPIWELLWEQFIPVKPSFPKTHGLYLKLD